MRIPYYILLIASLTACTGSDEQLPAEAVATEKLIPLLVDIHLSNAESDAIMTTDDGTTFLNDSNACVKNGIEFQSYKATMTWYKEHPERLSNIYEEVINELSRRQSETTGVSAR